MSTPPPQSPDLNLIGNANQGVEIGRATGQAFLHLFQAIARPLTLTTGVFFRRNFGERYFTIPQVIMAAAVVLLAALATQAVGLGNVWPKANAPSDSFSVSPMRNAQPPVAVSRHSQGYEGWIVGLIWVAALAGAAVEQAQEMRRRDHAGRRWHSYSPGVPRAPWCDTLGASLITIAAATAFWWFGLYAFAGLAVISMMLSLVTEHAARRALWNKMLDVIDAQIESDQLQRAVDEHAGPMQNEGLTLALPARARKQFSSATAAKPAAGIETKPDLATVSAP